SSSSNCGEGYSCSYTNSISWIELPPQPQDTYERSSPLPMELNPQVGCERLFGSGSTPEMRAKRMHENRSILDSVLAELSGLSKNLGASDRRTVGQYTDEIREIERRIQIAAKASATIPEIAVPPGIPESFDDHVKLQFDLTALAFRADITRVATLLGARDLTARAYVFPNSDLFPNGGVSVGFHGGSHHQEDPIQIRRYADLNRYHVSTLAYFAEKLKSIPEGDGTLLDRSLIMYGTNMGNSNQHQHYDVPHILVGGANGQLKGNRHLAYERKTVTTGNLLLSVLDLYGIHKDSQGDSTDRLPKLAWRGRGVMRTSITIALILAAGWAGISAAVSQSDVADAVMKGDAAALRVLLLQHADVNAPQVDGARALHWAVHRGDLETLNQLIRAGAAVNVANREGVTPLLMAAMYGQAPMIEALLKAGPRPAQRRPP